MRRRRGRTAALLALAAAVPLTGALAGSGQVLAGLDRGQWELRYRDGTGPARLCLRSGRELVQIRHPSAGCRQVVLDDTPARFTVQYMCRNAGYGRTELRRETPRLVQLRSEGVAQGRPFQITAEARRTGECGR